MNNNFVSEYLTRYEEHNLRSYNSGGYAYETARISFNLESDQTIMDKLLLKDKPTLEEVQRRATEV